MAWRNNRRRAGWHKKMVPKAWFHTVLTKETEPIFDQYFTEPRIVMINEWEFSRKWDVNYLLKRRDRCGDQNDEENQSKYFLTYSSDTSRSIRTFISKSILGGVAPSTTTNAELPLSYSGENYGQIPANLEDISENSDENPENTTGDQFQLIDQDAGKRRFDLLITKYKLRVHFNQCDGVTLYLVIDEGRKWEDRKDDRDFGHAGFDRLCVVADDIFRKMKKRFGDGVIRSWEVRFAELVSSSSMATADRNGAGKSIDSHGNNQNGDRSASNFGDQGDVYINDQDGSHDTDDGDDQPNNGVNGGDRSDKFHNQNFVTDQFNFASPSKRDHRGNRIQSQQMCGRSEASQLLSALVAGSITSSESGHGIDRDRNTSIGQFQSNIDPNDDVITIDDDDEDVMEVRNARIQTDPIISGFCDQRSMQAAALAPHEDSSPNVTIDLDNSLDESIPNDDAAVDDGEIEVIGIGNRLEGCNTDGEMAGGDDMGGVKIDDHVERDHIDRQVINSQIDSQVITGQIDHQVISDIDRQVINNQIDSQVISDQIDHQVITDQIDRVMDGGQIDNRGNGALSNLVASALAQSHPGTSGSTPTKTSIPGKKRRRRYEYPAHLPNAFLPRELREEALQVLLNK